MRYLLGLLVFLASSCTGVLKDRHTRSPTGSDDITTAQTIIKHAIHAHGGKRAFKQLPILFVELDDQWVGFARFRRPWPSDRMFLVIDVHQSRIMMSVTEADLANGNGWIWDGQRLEQIQGGNRSLADDVRLAFVMKAFAFMAGLPFNLEDNTQINFAGEFAKSHDIYNWIEVPGDESDPTWYLGFDVETGLIRSLVSPAPLLAGNDIVFEAIWSEPLNFSGWIFPTKRDISAQDGQIPIHHVQFVGLREAKPNEAHWLMDGADQ